MNTVSVRWVSRMLTPNCAQVSELLKRYRHDPAKIYFTTCYSGWNVYPPLRFWVITTKHAMERKISQNCHFNTLRNSVFSMSNANNRRPLKCTKYLQPKSHSVYVVFRALLLQEANTILILFWTELGQAENFLITPRKIPIYGVKVKVLPKT